MRWAAVAFLLLLVSELGSTWPPKLDWPPKTKGIKIDWPPKVNMDVVNNVRSAILNPAEAIRKEGGKIWNKLSAEVRKKADTLKNGVGAEWNNFKRDGAAKLQAYLVSAIETAFPVLKGLKALAVAAAAAEAFDKLRESHQNAKLLIEDAQGLDLKSLKPFIEGGAINRARKLRASLLGAIDPFTKGILADIINVKDIIQPVRDAIQAFYYSIEQTLTDIKDRVEQVEKQINDASSQAGKVQHEAQDALDAVRKDIIPMIKSRVEDTIHKNLEQYVEDTIKQFIEAAIVRAVTGL